MAASTYTVSNLNDSGTGTLRAAITAANAGDGNKIAFSTSGTITLASPLPAIDASTTVDGSTAPGFTGNPVVTIDFNGNAGLVASSSGNGAAIRSLSLVGSRGAGLTLQGSRVSVQGNYIGLMADGSVQPNSGDGISIQSTASANLIGSEDAVTGVTYFNTTTAPNNFIQPVSAWQGLRNYAPAPGQFLICGTSNDNGLLYTGPLNGNGGASYLVNYTDATTTSIKTSVYGPDNLDNGAVRLVGIYTKANSSPVFNYGFVWEGTLDQLPTGGKFRTINYPGAVYQYTHSTMGNLAVGNADGPKQVGSTTLPIGPGVAYIYDLTSNTFITNIVYPGSKSNTAYGIWQNSTTKYTICGGYSPLAVHNLTDQNRPLEQGKAFLVDYDSEKNELSNWTSFEYPNGPAGVSFISHFEGISSAQPGVYTLNADSVQSGSSNPVQGSWVSVRRNSDNTFDQGIWVDLNYPSADGVTSSNSVYGHDVVGLVIGSESLSYQATVNIAFQRSNVISGNRGNGISISGSSDNIVAMNYIGADPAGSTAGGFGNGMNGVLVTSGASRNLIGGQIVDVNNPTGDKNPANAVFQRPPQGNLISGNFGNGVLINGASIDNTLSGNFIGTDESGVHALGNWMDGIVVDSANRNSLIGCTLFENPFVFYNVVAGNRGHGVRISNSDDVTIQANFMGMGADNATSVPNGGDGLLVAGSSRNTHVGGVIPLGNVISGNALNGIEVRDSVSGFISFNTFAGVAAFQVFPSPNGLNGILVTATGGNNTIRTCIVSGNSGNGIELGGDASGVQITETSVGTTTNIGGAIPNLGNGIVIGGTAHNNAIGGFQPSVEPEVFVSGNKEYGILITDQAANNQIYHSKVGIGASTTGPVPNGWGGILLDQGTRGTTIGGANTFLQTVIESNGAAGLYIYNSTLNTVTNNSITDNQVIGLYAYGVCTGTVVNDNTIQENGVNGTDNVDISRATGITYTAGGQLPYAQEIAANYARATVYFAAGDESSGYFSYAAYSYYLYLQQAQVNPPANQQYLNNYYQSMAYGYYICYTQAGQPAAALAWYNYFVGFIP